MRLQGLVEGVDAHAVGGRQQRELLVDHRLDRGDAVAVAARGVDARLQGEVRVVQSDQPLLHVGHALAQFALQTASRTIDDLLVGDALPLFVLRVEVVGIGLEERAEDAAVAFGEVLEYDRERVVTLREGLVFAAQAVGRVLHLRLERGVEEDREADVVEHGGPQPHEQVDGRAAGAGVRDLSFRSCQYFSKLVSRRFSISRSYSSADMLRLK